MTEAQDRYDAAAQRHSDALERAIAKARENVTLSADLEKAKADYEALLMRTTGYLDASATALNQAIGGAASEDAATTSANPATPA
jgi:hypothetical protein